LSHRVVCGGLFLYALAQYNNNMHVHTQTQRFFAIFLIFAVFLSFFYPFSEAKAAIPLIQPLNKPFGGKITKIQACLTPPGFILHIGPPVGGKFFLNPATTIIHPYGVIQPGVWTLGNAAPVPINCSKGNPSGIGGFSIGGLMESAGGILQINPIYAAGVFDPAISGAQIIGAQIIGPLGAFQVTGPLAETLLSAAGGFGNILPGIGIISSLMGGDFFGAGISLVSLFVGGPIGAVVAVASAIFSFLGIGFGKKPPSLGSAYPIIHIGTGPAPNPIPALSPSTP